MDVAVDSYQAVPLLFTVLALVLASVCVSLRGAAEKRDRELPAAEAAREGGPGDQAAVAEQREEAVEGRKEAAAGQREQAEEPSPAAEPNPTMAESIPRKSPAEPQEDAGAQAALPSKAEEEDLDSGEEKLVERELASTAATSAPVTSAAASLESSEGFKWLLGALGTCLLIVMVISMLAHTQSVFYPQPFCLIPKVKQSQVWVLSKVTQGYRGTRRLSPRLDSHERQGMWDSVGEYLVHWTPPVLWKHWRWKAAVWSPQQQAVELLKGMVYDFEPGGPRYFRPSEQRCSIKMDS